MNTFILVYLDLRTSYCLAGGVKEPKLHPNPWRSQGSPEMGQHWCLIPKEPANHGCWGTREILPSSPKPMSGVEGPRSGDIPGAH